MDLYGAGGDFRWPNSEWADILELGRAFGWVPIGTGPPRGVLKAEWKGGSYFGNDGQRFYARDCRALADALELAIEAISKGKAPALARDEAPTDELEARLCGRRRSVKGRVVIPKYSSEDIKYIRDFIKFCRAGSFRIA